jgi:hypothetical protein
MASSHRADTPRAAAAAVAAVLACFLVSGLITGAKAQTSEQDNQCLGCHGSAGFQKKLDNGETLPLHVDAHAFAGSVHAGNGCASCHADIDLNSHPAQAKAIPSTREFSLSSAQACRGCHADQFEQWEKSVHAALAREGNGEAPICTGCHQPHAVVKGTAETLEGTPCRTCHAPIFNTYVNSVHGKARAGGNAAAPVCSGCHGAHEVKAAFEAMGEAADTACVGCHSGALDAHRRWLPNTDLHFSVISCPVCHAPGTQRRVDLKLFDSGTGQRVSEQRGVPVLEGHAGAANGQGLDALALWNLLRTFNRQDIEGKTVLRGRLEVRSGAETHQLADKSKAVSDCKSCHRAGSDAFQSVTISLAGPGGTPLRYGAEKDVLSSVISLNSVGGFYAIGGTRVQILDILFLLALFAGIAIPIGHLSLRLMVKHYLKTHGGWPHP